MPRKAINKEAGDTVIVTLYMETENLTISDSDIETCFKDADVWYLYKKLPGKEQAEIAAHIRSAVTRENQAEKIVESINRLLGG
ncbi:MAG: hypothetical protein ACXITV_05970 [Luteibaculaceae bacterium]